MAQALPNAPTLERDHTWAGRSGAASTAAADLHDTVQPSVQTGTFDAVRAAATKRRTARDRRHNSRRVTASVFVTGRKLDPVPIRLRTRATDRGERPLRSLRCRA